VSYLFKESKALVTGGTSGIGLAIAKALADEGVQVIAAGLNAVDSDHDNIRVEELDVTDFSALQQLVNDCGELDYLVNSAGIIRRQEEYNTENFVSVLDVNLTAIHRLCTLCQPKLEASSGSILNIGSLYSNLGAPHAAAYAANKGGVVQLTKSFAAAWALKAFESTFSCRVGLRRISLSLFVKTRSITITFSVEPRWDAGDCLRRWRVRLCFSFPQRHHSSRVPCYAWMVVISSADFMTNSLQATQSIADLVTQAIPDDERLWVPQAEKIWFRPLLLNTTNGEWVNLLRIAKGGVMNRHRHPAPVYGYVLKGQWCYLEHDWVAKPGMFVFEPPGEIHTLVVDEDSDDMITLFHVFGALVYFDENDKSIQHDDVHTKIEMCRSHFEQVGLGADFVKQYIR